MATLSSTYNQPRLPRLSRRWLWTFLLIFVLLYAVGQTGLPEKDLVNERGWRQVSRFFAAALTPELSPEFLAVVANATLQTFCYAVLGILLSLIIGYSAGLLASEVFWLVVLPPRARGRHWYRLPFVAVRALLTIPRAIHELIWGLFFLNIFGLSPLTAIFAIGLHFGAVTAKVVSEILDETPRSTFLALINSGAGPLKAFLYGLLPTALPNLVSYSFYRFECAIRASAILGVIGAGGLGYEILLSLQSLKYDQLWPLLVALIALSGITDMWSSMVRARLGKGAQPALDSGSAMAVANMATNAPESPSWRTRLVDFVIGRSGLLFMLMVGFSLLYVRPDFSLLGSPRTARLWQELSANLFPPRLDAESISTLIGLTGQTLAMSVLAIALASPLALLLAFPAARNFSLPGGIFSATKGRFAWLRTGLGWAMLFSARAFLLVCRAIPPSIWALLVLFVFFPGIVPGAIALAIYTAGVLGRLMAEAVENLDGRPLRALAVGGAGGGKVFFYAVLPPAVPQLLAYVLYRWEVCIRETVIVGLVGAGGLGRLLEKQRAAFDYPGISATLIFVIGITFVVDLVGRGIRRAWR
jgi:phosphonate transport system permease protein